MKIRKWWISFILVIASALSVFPYIWMILTSFKTYDETVMIPIRVFPSKWLISNYIDVLKRYPVGRWYLNSFMMIFMAILGQIIFASLAAYAFARLSFPCREVVFILFLSVMMVPEQIFIIPRYQIMSSWGLINNEVALWLPKLFSVFAVFLLRQSFRSLPRELDEAAMIEGCGYFRIYLTILMPLLKVPLVSLAILSGLGIWKDLMWPLIVIRDTAKKPVIAGLALIADAYNNKYQYLMVGGVLGTLPVIIIFFILQKQFVRGIASEGVKK
jgi:multiple sugar transport system permease protein